MLNYAAGRDKQSSNQDAKWSTYKTHPVNVKSYSCFSLRIILAWESLPSQLQWSRFTGKQERRRFKDGKRKDVKNHKEAESWALERRWWGFFDRNSLAGTEGERERWKGKDRECEILWWPLWLMVFQRGSAEIFNLFKQKRCSRCSTHRACDNYIFGALWAAAKCIQCSHRLPTAFIPPPSTLPYCCGRRLYHMWVCYIYRTGQGRRIRFIFRGRIREWNGILEINCVINVSENIMHESETRFSNDSYD